MKLEVVCDYNQACERMNNSHICFLSAEHWRVLYIYSSNEGREELVISQPLPMCLDLLLVPRQLIHLWHDLKLELLVPSLPLQWGVAFLVVVHVSMNDHV